jgi:PIN domain nuclease of toxin-antitoxin system
MIDWVLDASAALALLLDEPGADRVATALTSAMISSVNAAEVVDRPIRGGGQPRDARRLMLALDCLIVSVDAELGLRAGVLSSETRSKGLSLGDRVCLALAEREQVPALTADPAWRDLDLGIRVQLIR